MGTGYGNDGTAASLSLYDATGRRVAKRVQVSGYNGSDLWTFYTYDGWRVLEERELTNANGLPALKRQFVYGNYLDEPLAMDVDGGGDGVCVGGTGDKRYLYLQNTLFSVTGLVDASNGALVEAYAYDPYGRHWRITNAGNAITDFSASTLTFALGAASPLGNPYLFTGQRFDPETGLHYYKMRYYDCGLGRFVSRDPIGIKTTEGSNQYQYVSSQPTIKVDSYGNWGINVHQHATTMWAGKIGYPDMAAQTVGESDEAVDHGGTSFWPHHGQEYHFNRNIYGGIDSRKERYQVHYNRAKVECSTNDDGVKAAVELGTALHPYQDWVAHGDYGKYNEDEIWTPHNQFSPQKDFGWDPSDYPDNVCLDAVKGPNGRPAGAAMHWGSLREYAIYQMGTQRYRLTNSMTESVLSKFMEFVKSKGGCNCRKYFRVYGKRSKHIRR